MSDLGQLFRLSTTGPKPRENFTTTALAIAIRCDKRPILEALRRLEGVPPGLTSLVNVPADHRRVEVGAETQKTLWTEDGKPGGYLDLVLDLKTVEGAAQTIWVEVKVDAWESGDQIAFYLDRAQKLSPRPEIVTLGRTRVTDRVRHLTWRTIVDSIEIVSNPHYTWVALRDFLLEERIALPRISSPAVDASACVEVLIEANDRVKHHWPKKGTGLTWTPGALRTTLQKHLEKHPDRDLLVVVGPLRYGLVKTEGLWLWTIRLSVGRNYERVRLDPKQVLHDVIAAGLPNDWEIYPDRLELLERTQEPGTLSTAEATLEWLDQGFSDLKRGNVLRLFFEGLEEKARARSHPAVD